LLGIATLVAAVALGGSAPAVAIDSRITNAALYAEADSYPTGQSVGNCKQWVGMVFEAVAIDAGSSARIGPGFYSGFVDAGGVTVPLSEAQRGDLVYVYEASDLEGYHYGMHAAFVVDNLGNGVFDVIDANYQADPAIPPDGTVQRHTWDTNAYLAMWPGLEVTVFRLGTVPETTLKPVYRFYNVTNGTHFYTPSAEERDMVKAKWPTIFTYEGVAYSLDPAKNPQPLFRFYNNYSKSHFYTASAQERDMVKAKWPTIFTYEGETYPCSPVEVAGSVPVYRFYNVTNGSHFYTASAEERDAVMAKWPTIYTYEGPAFWLAQ
jgi:hypothetical protein